MCLAEQIDVAVNAPEAGTVKEYLAKEDDTVTVGQDIVRLELGEASKADEKQPAAQEPKAPASNKQSTSSDPDPSSSSPPKEEPAPQPEKKPTTSQEEKLSTSSAEAPVVQENRSSNAEESKQPLQKRQKTSASEAVPYGSREERRVIIFP